MAGATELLHIYALTKIKVVLLIYLGELQVSGQSGLDTCKNRRWGTNRQQNGSFILVTPTRDI